MRCTGSYERLKLSQGEIDTGAAVCHACGRQMIIIPNLTKREATMPSHKVREMAPAFVMPPGHIPLSEAAASAGLSETLIRRWVSTGRVAGIQVSRKWFVDEASLRAHLALPRERGRPVKAKPADVIGDLASG